MNTMLAAGKAAVGVKMLQPGIGKDVSSRQAGPFWLPVVAAFLRRARDRTAVLNNDELSPEQEMVEDLLTIVHCFSARLYGLGNYRKNLREALAEDVK